MIVPPTHTTRDVPDTAKAPPQFVAVRFFIVQCLAYTWLESDTRRPAPLSATKLAMVQDVMFAEALPDKLMARR
jgi:hypothetical protein